MIASFGNDTTADLFHGHSTSRVRRLPQDVQKRALNKLDMLNAAHQLDDLRSPPGNRLEVLRGNLNGYHSIRVNNQWRIIFHWEGNDAHAVELIDYHG
jgi:proteic killer suppression protein